MKAKYILESNKDVIGVASHALFGIRPCLAEGSEAHFHGWTKITRCPIGDGSMLEWVSMAMVELPSGKVDLVEPYRIEFTDMPNVK